MVAVYTRGEAGDGASSSELTPSQFQDIMAGLRGEEAASWHVWLGLAQALCSFRDAIGIQKVPYALIRKLPSI